MCGICGIINFNKKPVIKHDVKSMVSKIKHRGPDDEGFYFGEGIGLGHVRLSILDLSYAGHQPMLSNNNRFVIVYNGEIYNYLELKSELKSSYRFKSGTDTEVVLAAYQKWGEQCLNNFNGMFAFVIYDTLEKKVFGARDRYGIKPLYYYVDESKFIFASEIKSIIPFVSKEQNNKIIHDYLLYNRTDHTTDTFFKNIKKIKHGSLFSIMNNKIEFTQWYDLKSQLDYNLRLSPEQYRNEFKDSIKLRLRADVPVGVCLSGGIDSSAIVSTLYNDFKLTNIHTFSAIYNKNDSSDESNFIDEYKNTINNMFFTSPTAESLYEDYEDFIEAHNEPVPDIGPYAQYKVMELAKDYVTVTLDGQGADEQLAGYHYFFGSYYLELIYKLKILKFITENLSYLSIHKSSKAALSLIYYIIPVLLQSKISQNRYPSVSNSFVRNNKSFDNSKSINELLYKPKDLNDSLLQHFEYKLEHLLRWEDLNSMNFSIESRVPFLDHNLVESTLSLPSNQKISAGNTKYILREALKDILPPKITKRTDKKGFSSPRAKWFRSNQFQELIYDIINSKSFKQRGYFNSDIANKQYKSHLENKIDASKEIWKWINLELWFRHFID